jgi:tetratricopeptide (TPR) repeat protein
MDGPKGASATALQSALAQLNNGEVEAAGRLSAHLIATAPNDPAHHQLAAEVALRRAHYDDADRWARSCLALRPGHAPAMMIAGRAAQALGDFERAREWFALAGEAAPGSPEPWFCLCLAQLECGGPTAQATLERIWRQFPHNARGWNSIGAALRKADKWEAAALAFARAFKASGDATHAIDYGAALTKLGRVAEAVAVFRLAATGAPDGPAAILGLAQGLRLIGEHAEARATLERGAERVPDNASIPFALGLVCDDLDDGAAAIAAYRRCVSLRPDLPEAQVNLGLALQRAGEWEAAQQAYRLAIGARPDTFGRIAQALPSTSTGQLWLDLRKLRRSLGG